MRKSSQCHCDNKIACGESSSGWSFVLYERPILDDEPKPHKLACPGRLPSSVTEMVKKQCQVWSPMCTNFASFNKANCKTYMGQN